MRRFLIFTIILSAAVGAAVALMLTQRNRMAPMSPDERRTYLRDKLGSRISDEQLDKLAAAISEKLDAATEKVTEAGEAVTEATEAAVEATQAAAEAVSEEVKGIADSES